MASTLTQKFYRLSLTTLVAVYFLIFVGGVVRTTGSGMGCPDWPKCFGSWIPPTSIDQLPADYKENYSAIREKKNQKFARYLRLMGMNEKADRILNDQSILVENDFNPIKTWIEYINRLVGVVIGILVMILFYRSIKLKKNQPELFWWSLVMLIVLIFQGWFGSIVISTNLITWTVTVHLFLALLIVAFLIFLSHQSRLATGEKVSGSTQVLLMACMASVLIQIFFGTEVRSSIDRLVNSFPRESWIDRLGMNFIVHRSFSWAVFLLHAILFFKIRKTISLKTLSLALFLLILCAMTTGLIMAYFAVPMMLQPIHLLLATLVFGMQLFLFFRMDSRIKAI